MKCLLLINTSSGRASKVTSPNSNLRARLISMFSEVDEVRISENDRRFNIRKAAEGYDALAVCGGDGTFNTSINAVRDTDIQLIYIPCGTLNDAAHTLKSVSRGAIDLPFVEADIGEMGGRLFSYVAATGSFTSIGFLPKARFKKVFKRLVYYMYAFKEYRCHRIKAEIQTENYSDKGEYTLIMAVKSKYVFGFKFNRLYSPSSGEGHLLTIKSPKGMFKNIKLFALFFRAFFVGFSKEHRKEHITFIPFSKLNLSFAKELTFCVDGERVTANREVSVVFRQKVKIMLP